MSISISPAITTTPALDSLFPIYWEDLTDEQKQNGLNITVTVDAPPTEDYTFTLTPTSGMYAGIAGIGDVPVQGENQGDSVSDIKHNSPTVENAVFIGSEAPLGGGEPPEKLVTVRLTIQRE